MVVSKIKCPTLIGSISHIKMIRIRETPNYTDPTGTEHEYGIPVTPSSAATGVLAVLKNNYKSKAEEPEPVEPGVFGSLEPEPLEKKKQEPEPLGKKIKEPEPEKNLPAPQPCR